MGINPDSREILEYKTGRSWDHPSEIYYDLFERIRKIQPDTIITMHDDKKHPDHKWIAKFIEPLIYQVAERIRLGLGKPLEPSLLLGENTRSQLEDPNFYVDITNTYRFKSQALRTQRSQLEALGENIFQNMRTLARYRAKESGSGVKYCEAFQEIHIDSPYRQLTFEILNKAKPL